MGSLKLSRIFLMNRTMNGALRRWWISTALHGLPRSMATNHGGNTLRRILCAQGRGASRFGMRSLKQGHSRSLRKDREWTPNIAALPHLRMCASGTSHLALAEHAAFLIPVGVRFWMALCSEHSAVSEWMVR